MTIKVRTAVFSGPLDLLVQLIHRRFVDVTRVEIAEIVGDFLERQDSEPQRRLDDTSTFLLLTAMLMHLKARFLTPDEQPTDLEEELALLDERDRILARLLTLLTFQDVATVLRRRIDESSRYVKREVGIDRKMRDLPPPPLPSDATPRTLAVLMENLTKSHLPEHETEIDHIDLDLPSVVDAMDDIRTRIAAQLESTFELLVTHCTRRVEVAAYFLAVLELARWGIVSVAQVLPSEISVRQAPTSRRDSLNSLEEPL